MKKPMKFSRGETLRESARQILNDCIESMKGVHNRTLDRDGDYSFSGKTHGAIETLEKMLANMK